MKIRIERESVTEYGLDGKLYINNEYVCDTTENPKHHLPEGEYNVQIRYGKRYERKVPFLTPVRDEDASAAVFHGNGMARIRDMRIHVGKFCVSGLVTEGQRTFLRLYDRMQSAFRRHKRVSVTIVNSIL